MFGVNDFIINEEETDEPYTCYNLSRCAKIFNQSIEDSDELRINIPIRLIIGS